MQSLISLQQYANGRLIGPRIAAAPILEQIELSLNRKLEVVLNFDGVEATQSFIDGLIGALILKRGPDVLDQLIFRACSPDVKAILEFVAADRCDQYLKHNTH